MEAIAEKKKTTEKIPDYLVREVIDGIPFYYKGFRDVLNKTKKPEEVMGCSGLQSIIISYLMFEVCAKLDRKKYHILFNELGSHIDHRNNLAYDLAIFEKSVLRPEKINLKFVDVPPKVVVEVDIRVELDNPKSEPLQEVIIRKTNRVFEFGAERLIWILPKSQKVLIAEKGKTWKIHDWNNDLEFMDGISFNVAKYLSDEGIQVNP